MFAIGNRLPWRTRGKSKPLRTDASGSLEGGSLHSGSSLEEVSITGLSQEEVKEDVSSLSGSENSLLREKLIDVDPLVSILPTSETENPEILLELFLQTETTYLQTLEDDQRDCIDLVNNAKFKKATKDLCVADGKVMDAEEKLKTAQKNFSVKNIWWHENMQRKQRVELPPFGKFIKWVVTSGNSEKFALIFDSFPLS